MGTVLVTGGSGFLGSHVVLQLLNEGHDVRTTVRSLMGDAARKVPTRELPSWLVRVAARFDRTLKTVVPLLDSTRRATSAKAERLLEWRPRSPGDAIVATAESLIKFGIVTAKAR